MSRLFITPREVDLINDITKEVIKDIIGQKIYYFPINEIKTKIHDVYDESPQKIFDNPIEIDAIVGWKPSEASTTRFGYEEVSNIELFLHPRDLIDKGINMSEGDFFSYGSRFFEVTSVIEVKQIYGEIEHMMGIKALGRESRQGNFISKIFGPTHERFSDTDAQQNAFIQQRGFDTNKEGVTGDKRDLQDKGILDTPISGPAEVSVSGSSTDDSRSTSAFYDE